MSIETENNLRQWESDDRDTLEDVIRHMNEFGRWHWTEVDEEGLRIWNMMFVDEIEDESPCAAVFSGVASQAADGAFAAVASALGVDPKALAVAAGDWYENQDDPPPAIDDAQKLVRIANAAKVWLDALQKKVPEHEELKLYRDWTDLYPKEINEHIQRRLKRRSNR